MHCSHLHQNAHHTSAGNGGGDRENILFPIKSRNDWVTG
uniref:Uncharacterized protein n=1 Tax=Anguilla anguilla TaxID=7936 RepID=A0A0E9UET9_ANGAN